MMYDVELPGHFLVLVQCPLCGSRPEPEKAYMSTDINRWKGLLASGDMTAVAAYLMEDRQLFEHGMRNGEACPAEPLPGPALIKLSGIEAMEQAEELRILLSRD
ncbi:hypothetical protein AB0M32_46015 [Streptomyces sp. NPDC051985]|uniref:hypothetical protein n=1 Tax=Streptomyces sp. NPDC051985 TaxID=3155807 RepID=UPI00342F0304